MSRTPAGGLASDLISILNPAGGSELLIGGVAAVELVEKFGTPLYVYDAAILESNYKAVCGALGSRIEVLYALKANPNVGVANVFLQQGSGAEVASAGEIHVALAAGFNGATIQFAGPEKTPSEIELGVEIGLGCFNIESESEYQAIASIARSTGQRPGIAIRVNPTVGVSGSRMRMSGGGKKFGVDQEDVLPLARLILEDRVVDLKGLHTYGGTQSFDASSWVANAQSLVDLAGELERKTGEPLRTLNFGGGFGVPYYEGDPTFDLAKAGNGMRQLIDNDRRPDRRYFVELGRYLTATSGVYLTTVTYVKNSGGARHVILDGGLHHHSAAAGVGSIMRRSFPMVNCRRVDSDPDSSFAIGGPLCTPADEFASQCDLPRVDEGDVLAVLISGAYGLSFSNVLFLSHPMPAEVLVDQGRAFVVAARGEEEDALRRMQLPEGL